jgi:hypothetical protein
VCDDGHTRMCCDGRIRGALCNGSWRERQLSHKSDVGNFRRCCTLAPPPSVAGTGSDSRPAFLGTARRFPSRHACGDRFLAGWRSTSCCVLRLLGKAHRPTRWVYRALSSQALVIRHLTLAPARDGCPLRAERPGGCGPGQGTEAAHCDECCATFPARCCRSSIYSLN